MSKLRARIRHLQLFELLRQKGIADHVSQRLRISRRSDGEGAETLVLRNMAERSLLLPHGQSL